jgi:Gram-negative porin
MLRPSLLAAVITSAASPVLALDFGSGFSLTGEVELEYFDTDAGSDIPLGFTDLILSWRNPNGGGLGFGVDTSIVSLHNLEDGGDDSALYLGLVFSTSFGEFAIGRPRALLDTLVDTPDIGSSKLLALEGAGVNESLYAISVLRQDWQGNAYGATFKGEAGALTYGLGIHRIEDGGSSADFAEALVIYTLGAAQLYATVETADTSGGGFDKYQLGGKYAADSWSFGGEYTTFSTTGADGDIVKIYGDYKVLDGLTLGVQYQDQELPFNAEIYGVSGTYSFGTGFAELGLGRINGSADTNFGTASIGFRF